MKSKLWKASIVSVLIFSANLLAEDLRIVKIDRIEATNYEGTPSPLISTTTDPLHHGLIIFDFGYVKNSLLAGKYPIKSSSILKSL